MRLVVIEFSVVKFMINASDVLDPRFYLVSIFFLSGEASQDLPLCSLPSSTMRKNFHNYLSRIPFIVK